MHLTSLNALCRKVSFAERLRRVNQPPSTLIPGLTIGRKNAERNHGQGAAESDVPPAPQHRMVLVGFLSKFSGGGTVSRLHNMSLSCPKHGRRPSRSHPPCSRPSPLHFISKDWRAWTFWLDVDGSWMEGCFRTALRRRAAALKPTG
jgi:hypothetical protein